MKLIPFIITLIVFYSGIVISQNQSIDNVTMDKIRKNYDTQKDAGLRNIISNNDIKNLVINRDVVGKIDHNFKYKVKVSGITDQKSSGRCWMFAGLNSLRPIVISSKELSSFDFSQNYLFFYDLLEKANLFLSGIIQYADKPLDDRTVEWLFKNPIGDGGVWNSFGNLVEKYGAVPKTVMPETYHSENTSAMNRLIAQKLREDGLKLRQMKTDKKSDKDINDTKFQMISEIYRLLTLFLGVPPTEFEYRFIDKNNNIGDYKKYTPLSFFKDLFPDYKSDDYVMLMNDPSRDYYKLYEIEVDRNIVEGKNWKYINLPADKLKELAMKSIKDNEALYASCDVGKFLNKNEGTLDPKNFNYDALIGVKFGMNKADRIKTFDSGSSHAMLLVAVDTDADDKPVKWQFENSWGASYGHNGYLTFTDDWFSEYMFRIVVNKKYVSTDILKYLDQKPILLPPWDAMF
jgi:bleomycin hydrolase